MHNRVHIYTLILSAVVTVALFASYSRQDPASTHAKTTRQLPQIVRSADLNKPFDLAGERVPMDNFDARERLERELMVNAYWHSSTALNIQSATRYFPVIEKILAENGLPDDFKYLAVAESNLRNESSPAGAKGIWQFMKGTGEFYGLEINEEVDERYHLEKATQAVCEYLKGYKKRFGTWTLAAAAYNMGGTRMAKELEIQRADNFYDLSLNVETARYVFRIIAIKEIMQDPQKYGFYIEKEDYHRPLDDYKTVTVSEPVANWGDFAKAHQTTYRMIKVYNPWLRTEKLTNSSGKPYEIRIKRP